MARGTALSTLVTQLRYETGRSATAVSNADEEASLKYALQRAQEFYKDAFDWPHLRARRTIVTVANRRWYDFPSDMDMENLIELWVKDGDTYRKLTRGIDQTHYNQFDSLQQVAATGSVQITAGTAGNITDVTVNAISIITNPVAWTTSHTATATLLAAEINGTTSSPNYTATASGDTVTITAALDQGDTPNTFVVTATTTGDVTTTDTAMSGGVDAETADPPLRWDIIEDTEDGVFQIEIWPVPNAARTIYVTGKKNLSALSADSDTADLDDRLLVLSAAAELLLRESKRDADAKAAAARLRFDQLRKREKTGSEPIVLRGGKPHGTDRTYGTTIRISRQ